MLDSGKVDVRTVSESSSYVIAVIAISLLALSAIVALAILRPLADNTLPILIIGFVAPTLAALLNVLRGQETARAVAVTSDQVVVLHDMVNSRLTQLLALTAAASRAEGVQSGRAGGNGGSPNEVAGTASPNVVAGTVKGSE